MSQEKVPENLGVVIASKDQLVWEKVRDESLVMIKSSKDNLMIQEAVLGLAEAKIAEEKEKFK
jgi:hypothetical protein